MTKISKQLLSKQLLSKQLLSKQLLPKQLLIVALVTLSLLGCQSNSRLAKESIAPSNAGSRQSSLTDDQLLDLVQRQTFRYFWQFAQPDSGMALERSQLDSYDGRGANLVTTGGTGFGIMGMIVAVERGFITRQQAVMRMLKINRFLLNADRFHGAFGHWYNGKTGKVEEIFHKDDGADIVETAFLMQGLLAARQYFDADTATERQLRDEITGLWHAVEWDWYTKGDNVLYWHWSPKHEWAINHAIRGHNETAILYVLAASSPTHPIKPSVYHQGYASGEIFLNGNTYFGKYPLKLGMDFGGPLFFTHYSYVGLDPRGLKDRYADYWQQNLNHTLINREQSIQNPNGFKGYGEKSWGLTASDSPKGYDAHSPTIDLGVITPTAALSSFPYTPKYSMQALKYFYYDKGSELWGPYGFYDAFSEADDWVADGYLAIDQGPIIVMIENHRSQLIWNVFMSIPEIHNGLKRLDFESPHLQQAASIENQQP